MKSYKKPPYLNSLMEKLVCNSCKTDIATVDNSTAFPCPSCGNKIIRCGGCRKRSVKYKCSDCSFTGP